MKLFLSILTVLICLSCSAQNPTKLDIEKALRSTWDRPATGTSPKQSIIINSIKIGSGAIANLQDRIDGIPDKARVTVVKIDFTVQEFYNQVQVTHRLMTAKAFKDAFGDWALKGSGMKIL